MARILIVDDDESDRLALRTILEASGHDVEVSVDGDEALRTYRNHPIDAVVTDIVMSGKDGVELILALREADPAAAIVAISGKGTAGLHFAGLAGAAEVLKKPVDQTNLLIALNKVLASRER